MVPFVLTLHENNGEYLCSTCNRPFVGQRSRDLHSNTHQIDRNKCKHCSKHFKREINKRHHELHCHPNHTPEHISALVAEADVSLSQANNSQVLPACNDGDDEHVADDSCTDSFPQLSTSVMSPPVICS